MVTSGSKPVTRQGEQPRFLYIAGCDGTGKSTQAHLLLASLQAQGARPRHLWLRFPFLLSLPLLAFARWRGYSWSEQHGQVRHGYWEFKRSSLLRALLPWLLLADAALAALHKVYLPLWRGQTIVCERFVLDMLADLAVAFDDPALHRRLPGRLFPRLLPQNAAVVVLDLDAAMAQARRADLQLDRRLEARLAAFRRIAADLGLATVSSAPPLDVVQQAVLAALEERQVAA